MKITKASTKAVNYACKHFHYSKSVPTVQWAYNIYNDNNEWCGVIVYGGSACNHLARSFGYNNGEVLELERVALNGKQEQTSRAVAMSLKQLHKDNPLVRLVVSYSDHRQRHLGTIYQATSWIYLGLTVTSDTQYFYKGKWTHERTINSRPDRDELKKKLPKRENSNKFKYVYCFGRSERRKWAKLALPYPKDEDITECSMQLAKKVLSR